MPDLSSDGRIKGRNKGGDRTIDDAYKTMERFTQWLQTAQEENLWMTLDPMNVAMLHQFLTHIRVEIDGLLTQGGDDARNAVLLFQLMERKE